MSTLLHVYKTVSAQLFRAQERSPVAEEAWAHALLESEVHLESTGMTFLQRLDQTRKHAVDMIHQANLPASLVEKAIAALDHAYYSAIAQFRQADTATNT